jgi:processive 1,2-diacylglycerol beta-glucosyltransferase
MKKVIILTASTGGGHNKVAQTLKEELLDLGHQVEVVDFLKSQNKIYEMIVSHGYELLASKFPTLYGELYKFSNSDQLSPIAIGAIRRSEKAYTKKVIEEFNPDLIVTTHPFAAAAIGGLKMSGEISQPVIAIVTDFIAHMAYLSEGIDHYIVGSPFTKKKLERAGILAKRIHAFGIPVSKEFYNNESPKNSEFTILVMGGSMGLSQMKEVVEELIEELSDLKLIIVTGNNKELYDKLEDEYKEQIDKKQIELYGFTKEVHKLMDQAHLVVTKPGGLTVSESIVKEVPLIVPFYIPGQEYENLMFLSLHGAAIGVDNPEMIPVVITHLKENADDYDRMKKGMASIKEHIDQDGFKKLVEMMDIK